MNNKDHHVGQFTRSFYNFTVTVEDFALLMQSAENYRHECSTLAIVNKSKKNLDRYKYIHEF